MSAFSWNERPIDQHETFLLIPVERFDPSRCCDGDGEATLYVGEPTRWTIAERSGCHEYISPPGLAASIDRLDVTATVDLPIDISDR